MNSWKPVLLKEIAIKIGSGATPTGGGEAYKATGTSLIRSQNVLDYSFSYEGLAFIDDDQAYGLRNVIVKQDDILLNITGDSVARCCSVPINVLPARVNQHVAIIRVDHELADPMFIKYNLIFQKDTLLTYSEVGATRRALTKNIIEDIEVKLPSLSEQRAIGEVLSSLDDKIDLLHRNNKTLEALAETIFRKWFSEEADGITRGKLGEIIDIHDKRRVPLSSTERDQLKEGELLFPYYGAASVMDYINKYIFDGDYLLIGEDGTVQDESGFPIVQRAIGKCWVNNHAHVLTAKPPFSINHLEVLIKNTSVAHIVTGAVQPKINQGSLKEIEILIPDTAQVERFNRVVDDLFDKRNKNNLQIATIKKLRDTLLPKLMHGTVTVNNFEMA